MNYLTRPEFAAFIMARGIEAVAVVNPRRRIILQLSVGLNTGERIKSKFALAHIPSDWNTHDPSPILYTFHPSKTSAYLWAETKGEFWAFNEDEDQGLFRDGLAAMNPIIKTIHTKKRTTTQKRVAA